MNTLTLKQLVTCMTLILTMPLFSQGNNSFPVQIQTDKGIIEGNYDTHQGLQTFFGVPFAKPPIGPLRWKAPEPMSAWEGVKVTKTFGPRPVQINVFGDMKSRSEGLSEDCLYLNVWAPTEMGSKKLPVLVYYYGGGNAAGDASEYRYDGASMAKKGMIVVTTNYRLNVFGNLAHPQLSAESPFKASGNYGSLDQVAALEWVKRNIAAFGGDPSKITIAGESAGSVGVSTLMASPLSRNLLAGAIGESGAAIYPTMAPVTLEEAENQGVEFFNQMNVPNLEALRSMSTREIYELFKSSGRFGFPLVIDGHFLPSSLPEIFEKGEQAQIPLLLGWNSAEIPGMAFMQGAPNTPENFIAKVKEAYPKLHKEILEVYPHASEKEVTFSATALASDRFIVYSTWKWGDLHANHSKQAVYRYLYSKLRPPLKDQNFIPGLAGGTVRAEEGAAPRPQAIGAPHACEIEYCMGNLHLVDDYAWTAEDYKVSEIMQGFFANFILNGNPNSENLPEWPILNVRKNEPQTMVIDVESASKIATDDLRFKIHDSYYSNN